MKMNSDYLFLAFKEQFLYFYYIAIRQP